MEDKKDLELFAEIVARKVLVDLVEALMDMLANFDDGYDITAIATKNKEYKKLLEEVLRKTMDTMPDYVTKKDVKQITEVNFLLNLVINSFISNFGSGKSFNLSELIEFKEEMKQYLKTMGSEENGEIEMGDKGIGKKEAIH